jgi:bifunctional DNA-binding transcriptional regulator/antitoxin component of YhaV-PrlF toxin-antitoxin module
MQKSFTMRNTVPERKESKMTLMRVFSKVDKEGKIKLPGNIQRAAGLKEGQLVELKIVGASRKKNVLVSAKGNAR